MFGPARRTWVLGGGGARGAAQVGVLQALFEANIEAPAAVVGTSVGALNGASIAAYPSLADSVQKTASLYYQDLQTSWVGRLGRRIAAWSQ